MKKENLGLKQKITEIIEPESIESTQKLIPTHDRAEILVKIFGDTFSFDDPSFQMKSPWIHFEGMDGSTVHKRVTGVTLGYLFETLNIGLDDQCYVFPDGKSYCTNEYYILKFFINEEQVSDIRDYEIMEGDRILIIFGSETPKEIEELLQEITLLT